MQRRRGRLVLRDPMALIHWRGVEGRAVSAWCVISWPKGNPHPNGLKRPRPDFRFSPRRHDGLAGCTLRPARSGFDFLFSVILSGAAGLFLRSRLSRTARYAVEGPWLDRSHPTLD